MFDFPTNAPDTNDRQAALIVLAVVVGITLIRLGVLFCTPLELYPDEAQYWLWSRDLAWGYVSKPPMVAWLIGLTTIGSDSEAWVRLSSTLIHAIAPLILFDTGRRLYGAWPALLAAVIYSLMPGVQLSAGVISTDAALMLFACGALWAYVRLGQMPPEARRSMTAAGPGGLMGLCLGLGFLSKYAAIYTLAGLALHAAFSSAGRKAWTPAALGAGAAGLVVTLTPNLVWNAHHGFATFAHTAANADWRPGSLFHPGQMFKFLVSQIGVFGPVPFIAVFGGAVAMAVKGRLTGPDRLLLAFAVPPVVVISVQALLSRANANWAFVAYGPASILAAAWLTRWNVRRTAAIALGGQALLAAAFLAGAARPDLADRLGLGNSLKQARGWRATTQAVLDLAQAEPGLTAVAVDDRFVFNEISYYGRRRLSSPGTTPLRIWVREARPMNQAEMRAPLTGNLGDRVLAVSAVLDFRQELMSDFAGLSARRAISIPLDGRRRRDLVLFVGSGFRPRPVRGAPRP